MSFRNRCQIAGGEGMIDLSIPLAGGRDQKRLTKEVRIAEGRRWQPQHWRTIVSCYNRSPWFEYYRDGLEALFQRRADFLIDWNLLCFEWSLRALGMSKTIGLTERYQERYGPEEGMDWRGKIVPKHRGDWPAATYRQVFGERTGFIPNLSILDLLFCEGKEAVKYIRS